MGKYSDIVKSKNQAAQPKNQKTVNIDSSKTSKQQNNKTGKTDNQTEREDLVRASRDVSSRDSSDFVNLSIKVPRKLRQKWVAESRLRGTTLTAIITEYLKSELGE